METKTLNAQPKVIIKMSQLSFELLEKIVLQVRAAEKNKTESSETFEY